MKAQIIRIYALLICLNAVTWALALLAFAKQPVLLGSAILAYTFGLRHAVDADHIAAIDNVTRKLMQERKRPVGVGLFFSLGHSTVVVALALGIAIGASIVKNGLPAMQNAGGLIGTLISAAFLFAIAAINFIVLVDIARAFRRARRGEALHDGSLEETLNNRGLMGRFFRPLMRMVDASWKMYPVGVLFGLGFDTATEIGLLGIAAIEAGKGIPLYDVLIFALLFTAGMSLLDTTDGVLMLGAYGWAFVKPVRKLYYNLVITLVSVVVAVFIGTLEALAVAASHLHLHGGAWDGIEALSGQFGALGLIVTGILVASWAVSTIVYKLKRYDETEVVFTNAPTV